MRNVWLYPSERLGHILGLMVWGSRFIERQMADSTVLVFSQNILKHLYPQLFVRCPLSQESLKIELSFLKEPEETLFPPFKDHYVLPDELTEINSYLQRRDDHFIGTKVVKFASMRFGTTFYHSSFSKKQSTPVIIQWSPTESLYAKIRYYFRVISQKKRSYDLAFCDYYHEASNIKIGDSQFMILDDSFLISPGKHVRSLQSLMGRYFLAPTQGLLVKHDRPKRFIAIKIERELPWTD